jgi:hypothetical protein
VIIDAIQNLAQIFTKSSASTAGDSGREASYQLQLTPGQQVQAEVLANLPNQRFLARIAGELFRIELPVIVQPGETLSLTFVSGEPNPTFTLSRSENSASPVTISDTGKLLNQLSLNPTERQQISALQRGNPVLTGTPPGDTALFAKLLGEALSFNGLFYESHLLEWVMGERQIRDILKEPHGKLANRAKLSTEVNSSQKNVNPNGKGLDGEMNISILDELLSDDSQNLPIGPINPRTIPIIQEQLHTLHSGEVIWQGQVWPRQQMEWSVREEKQSNGREAEKSWASTLRLDFPNLGEVNATLHLGKDGLSIHINTDRDTTSAVMKKEQQRLEQAMSNAGIKLLNMAIDHEEHGKGA